MRNAVPDAVRILDVVKKGSSLPLILDLLRASEGMNLAFPFHAERIEYGSVLPESLPEGERLAILLFDILILNLDERDGK